MICLSHKPNRDGYVKVKIKENDKFKQRLLHRSIYEHVNGPLTPNYHVHHICEMKLCCNPAHLQALTDSDHARETNKQRNKRKRINVH